jgi:CheY-like chemotaxis protein
MDTSRNLGPTRGRPTPSEPRSSDLAQLCRAALREVAPAAARKGQELVLMLPEGSAAFAEDRPRVQAVLAGLLRVAVRLAPERMCVRVEAALSRITATFRVAVLADYGEAALLPHDDAEAGREMALVRRLVALGGGTVSLDGEGGVGLLLSASLPVRVAPCEPRPRLERAPQRIVLAEDDEASADFTAAFLVAQGYAVDRACDGEEAVALVRARRPALVLMDIRMPGLDGLGAIRAIRADEAIRDVPIIALTALAMPGDADRCLAAGADAYLSKPVPLRALLAVVVAHAAARVA